jgi:hypothetical protein
MELSEATLELLQNEAYVFLCREVVEDTLASLEREKAEIASTRPPFGVLARKETREAFTRSMRTALDNEAALRDRLAQISGIEEWLRPSGGSSRFAPGSTTGSGRFSGCRSSWSHLPASYATYARPLTRPRRQAAA